MVDSSAVIAILRQETDADTFIDAIDAAAAYAAIVIDSARDPVASRRFDQFIAEADIRVEPVTPSQARIARDAYRDYGKGSGHKAALNFGDCFAYALAKETGEPLLFKGDDFSCTDIASALDGR